ncbi:zinc ABC transporter substrate-binding protein [Acidiferrimicrobium sp. IK]|uniref:metal ABC transporter solute-binding protein, Zn/Mn family n=1 Tax=Acidiferrimicrobium sp. IK TaxID=2871700 RepID=UPI0021CAF4C8|nr:zinc ABC transporter substrate-binding protein [Acidiferrimicrobium sp. IK]MCU4182830.1 zinc ABC transporter substrate-binding protein [Acidiferrimicrobium sp. IK]
MRTARRLLWAVAVVGLVAGCASAPAPAGRAAQAGRVLQVVAAENEWGSIAAQVGGAHVQVTSIITNPNADPHAYEPTAADARAVAAADLVWYNGIGYDGWMPKLLAADTASSAPDPARVLDVGRVVGAASSANPHRWYNPADVHTVIGAYVGDLSRLDPADADYFKASAATFEDHGLAAYHQLIGQIKARFAGTPVGASESIFSMLAPALGLDLITPPSFLRAISEGSDVSAADKATIDRQISGRRIKAYIYNSQNTTPDVRAQINECRAAGIPTATITETLAPPGATYQQWQVAQLRGIQAALVEGTRR